MRGRIRLTDAIELLRRSTPRRRYEYQMNRAHTAMMAARRAQLDAERMAETLRWVAAIAPSHQRELHERVRPPCSATRATTSPRQPHDPR